MVKIPRGDKTGPEGKGPKTGRGLGNCNTTTSSKGQGRGVGLGRRGQGRGQGRQGFREDLKNPQKGV